MSNRFLKGSLLSTTVIAGLAFASPAYAQDPNVAAAAKDQTPATQECTPGDANCVENPADVPTVAEDDSQAIVVTGSRIVSPNITSIAPVQVIGETDIDQAGALNIQEVLLENPIFGVPGLSRTNSAFLTSGAGVATADLRDLGSDRTLILINSRRVVAGLSGSATVDLNVIPTQFIERVDILTGGASSLYGSDAVAGVVNFLYKRNFSGLLAEGQYGLTERGDSARYQLNLTGGGNFADDRGNIMMHLGYTKEKGLASRERKGTRTDGVSAITYSYDPEDFFTLDSPRLSSFAPQGRFIVGDSRLDRTGIQPFTFTFSPTGALQGCFTANGATCSVTARGPLAPGEVEPLPGAGAFPRGPVTGVFTGVGTNGFNRQQFRTLAVPVERYIFATRGTFEITDKINAIAEATYVKTSSSREIEPFPLDSDDIFANARAPIETLIGGVVRVNPFVPTGILAVATDTDGDGLRDLAFAKRLDGLGTRNSEATRDFYRVVAGLEGKLLDDRFNWDISYNYGQTSEQQTSNGQPNVLNFRSALSSVVDTTDLDGDSNVTEIICTDATARAQGCVPINIFGFGSISPEAAAFVRAEQTLQTKITQQVWSANLSGAVVELPAGPLGIAVGAEYRKETSRENNDALTNSGQNAGNALPDTSGSFNVKEIYGEINVPILKDVPFFQALNLRAAGRVSDYSTVGSVNTYSLGVDWTPVDMLRFRATYAKAVRAPNIGELFTGPSQTFPSGLADPCVGITLASTGTLATQCRSFPGVLANIAANGGVFTVTQPDRQGISGFNSGNPDLGVEKSRSITAGVVFNPRSIQALRNLVVSVDYYNIEIKDAIVAAGRQFTLNQCFQQAVQQFCDLITRRAAVSGSSSAGSLQFINAPAINGGELKVEGIDFVAAYRTNLNRFWNGLNMNARVAYTRLLESYIISIPGSPKDPFIGEIGNPKNKGNATLAFNTDKFGLSVTGTYIGESFEDNLYIDRINAVRLGDPDDPTDDIGPPFSKKDIAVDSEIYIDSQITFTPHRKYEFFFGVDNLFDNDAPRLLSATSFNTTGSATAADVYDVFGRRYYTGVRLRF